MSLFSELEKHTKNPGDCWGRYSSGSVSNKCPDSSENNPEDDEVCLISPRTSSSKGVRRSNIRNTRQQRPIEIKDDAVKEIPRSNLDKNPQEFHVNGANFKIPKTKDQTEAKNMSHGVTTNSGMWLNKKNGSLYNRKNHTELKFQHSLQGRPKRTLKNAKSPDPVKLQRDWNHTSSPTRPVRSSPRNNQSRTINNDSCYEPNSHDLDKPISSGNHQITPHRFPRAHKEKQLRLQVNVEEMTVSLTQKCISEQSEESLNTEDEDFREIPSTKSSTGSIPEHVSQDEIFCPLCGGALDKAGCVKCGKVNANADSKTSFFTPGCFYSSIPNKNKNIKTYSGRCPSSQINTKKRNQIRNGSRPGKKQLENNIPASEETKGRKRKNDETINKPELVHISSDEDDAEEKTSRKLQAPEEEVTLPPQVDKVSTDYSDYDFKEQEMDEPAQLDQCNEEHQAPAEHLGQTTTVNENSAMDFSLSDTKPPKRVRKRQKDGTKEEEDLFRRDALNSLLIAEQISVGRLHVTVDKPVEVTAEKICISVTHEETNLVLKIEGRDLASFKISNESDPAVVLIVPTPGWARKINERYRQFGTFIDPGSPVYEERQILLILREKLTRTLLSDLNELVVERLAGNVWATITPQEGKVEVERILPSSNNCSKTDSSVAAVRSTSPSSSATSDTTFLITSSPRKSYSTRSKDVPKPNIPKKHPEKLLVYPAECKHGGITVTTEDVECLQPDTYLNDVIIDFFMKYLTEEVLSDTDKGRTHIFSSFFYKRLTQKSRHSIDKESRTPERMHSLVKTWTKNVDIFSKDFLIFPINERAHWYLCIVCYPALVAEQYVEIDEEEESRDELTSPKVLEKSSDSLMSESDENKDDFRISDSEQDIFDTPLSKTSTRRKKKRKKSVEKVPLKSRPCILIFDSLGSCRRTTVLVNLRNYLSCEWKERKGDVSKEPLKFDKDTLKGCYPKVLTQENMYDCGVYLMQYVQSFFENPIEDFNTPINLLDWFPVEVVREKREQIRNLIYELKDRLYTEDSS